MKTIGLDIGTSKICGILIDSQSGELLEIRTRSNDSNITGIPSWEKCQRPQQILADCRSILEELSTCGGDIASIGITGQMHGILYLDDSGCAVSPLYTWQDDRGNQNFSDDDTYASRLTRITGCPMATGYGLTTHFYMVKNHLVPEKTTVLCTIHDYVAMSLVNASAPLVHVSDAASLGMFNVGQNSFDEDALQRAGMDPHVLPAVTSGTRILGKTSGGIPVSVAIGDNQASFIGSVSDPAALLINVGTGSQISARVSKAIAAEGIQIRPFADDDKLCVGSPLCGGDSYAVLRDFFAQTAGMLDGSSENLYQKMDASAQELYPAEQPLVIDTRFRGTRDDPRLRGCIENISPANLTPGHLCLGVLKGICDELFSLYKKIPMDGPVTSLIGSGNGIRSSPLLQKIFTDTFGLTVKIPLYQEEAAYGAGLFSLAASGICSSLQEAQNKIRYR